MDDDRALRKARAFERFWDDLLSGRTGRPGIELDPDVVEAARRLRALSRPLSTDAAFEAALWEDLMTTHALDATVPLRPVFLPHRNGHHPSRHALPPRGGSAARSGPRRGVRLAAAAALSLVALGGWLLAAIVGSSDPGNDHRASIPGAQASPGAAPPMGTVAFRWQTSGDPADPMENATNLAIAPDGSIWVPDGQNGRFQIFSPDGELLEIWGSPGSGPGEFDFTTPGFSGFGRGAIAFAPDGSFYVADTGNQRIQRFGPDRSFLVSWGGEGLGDGQFLGISDIAVDAKGRVYAVDANKAYAPGGTDADTVQVFDAEGKLLDSWGASDDATGALTSPMGIAVDRDGTILIADIDLNRVERFTPAGDYLGGWGEFGTREGMLFGAIDVAVDGKGNVYEVDYSNSRVQVFDRDGRFLVAWGRLGTDDGEFIGPVAVAVDGAGNAYVTDDRGRLQKFRVASLP